MNQSQKTLIAPGWFRIAVQALVMIAESREPCSSAEIAHDVEAHAVFLRRVLAQLVRADIVHAREGRSGGYQLARPAGQITLADIYSAVQLTDPPDDDELGDCQSARLQSAMEDIQQEIEVHALRILSRYTIASLLHRVKQNLT